VTAPDLTESPLQQDPLYFLLLPHQVFTRVAGVENSKNGKCGTAVWSMAHFERYHDAGGFRV